MFLIKNKILHGTILLILSCYSYAEPRQQPLFDDKQHDVLVVQTDAKAKQPDKEEVFLLALAHQLGLGVPQDFNKALTLYDKAAELGELRAYYHMGKIYEQHNNLNRAMKFYQKAYDNGLEDLAMTSLAKVCLQLMENRLTTQSYVDYTKENNLCVKYNELSYKKDNSTVNLSALAKAKLVAFMSRSITGNEAKHEVLKWLDKAIAEGSEEAITNKGIYYQELGDNDKAKILFQEAASKGQVLAMNKMGEMFEYNDIEGIMWYGRAASYGSSQGVDKVIYFVDQYDHSSLFKELKKVKIEQLETIIDDLNKYLEYTKLNELDPILAKPFQDYYINRAISARMKLTSMIDINKTLDQYLASLQQNKPHYSSDNTVTMTTILQSGGFPSSHAAWKITTFSGDKVLAKGVTDEDGVIELKLTKPDNEEIINYLNEGGILRFGNSRLSWFLTAKLEGNIIDLTVNVKLAMLINASQGEVPEAYIYNSY